MHKCICLIFFTCIGCSLTLSFMPVREGKRQEVFHGIYTHTHTNTHTLSHTHRLPEAATEQVAACSPTVVFTLIDKKENERCVFPNKKTESRPCNRSMHSFLFPTRVLFLFCYLVFFLYIYLIQSKQCGFL